MVHEANIQINERRGKVGKINGKGHFTLSDILDGNRNGVESKLFKKLVHFIRTVSA